MTAFFQPLDLNADELRRLGGVMHEQTIDLEDVYGKFFDHLRSYHHFYNAQPLKKVRTFPFRNASNVVIPLIRTAVDATVARMFGQLQARRRHQWSGSSENEIFAKEFLPNIIRFINWGGVNEFDTFWGPLDWITEMAIAGCSVLVSDWNEEVRQLLVPSNGSHRAMEVSLKRGPRIRHWPLEHILWEPNKRVGESDLVITQSVLTGGDLGHRMFENKEIPGSYDEAAIKVVLAHPVDHGSPGIEIRDEKSAAAGIDSQLREVSRREYDVRTAWVEWPLLSQTGINPERLEVTVEDIDGNDTQARVPLLIDYEPTSKTILRVLPNPYLGSRGNPFYDIYFRKTTGDPRGQGLSFILENLQRLISTQMNQATDAVTLQNAMPFKTTNPELLQQTLTPGQGVRVNSMDELEPFNGAAKNIFPDIGLINVAQIYAERATGINDPAVGRETRAGGHPSTATGTLALLDTAKEIGSPPVRMMREQWSRVGETVASLYQQFDTDDEGRITRIFGAGDGARINAWMFPTNEAISGNMMFDVAALSEDENPQEEVQRAILTSQTTQQYLSNVLQVVGLVSRQDIPDPVKQVALKAVMVFGTTHQRVLEALNFDQAQEAILQLQDPNGRDPFEIQRIGQALAELAGSAGAGGNVGPGGGPGATPFAPIPGVPQLLGAGSNGAAPLLS